MLHFEGNFESIGLDFIWREEQQRCAILNIKPPEMPRSEMEEGNQRRIKQSNGNGRWQNEFEALLKASLDQQQQTGEQSNRDQQVTEPGSHIQLQSVGEINPDSLRDNESEDSRFSFDRTQLLWVCASLKVKSHCSLGKCGVPNIGI